MPKKRGIKLIFPSCKVIWGLWYRIYYFEDSLKTPIIGESPFMLSHIEGGVTDLSQSETSRSCQRSIEMVGRQGWNVWWVDREIKEIIPYVLMAAVFRNGIGLLIVLLWMYIRNVRLNHQPIFSMLLLFALCRFIDVTPPTLIGFEILHVEYYMYVQVVGLMVPWRLALVLTFLGAWYLHLWFPVCVPLHHEINKRNVKCVSAFL